MSAYVAGNASVLNPVGCPYGMTVIPACIRKTNDPGNHAEYGCSAGLGTCAVGQPGKAGYVESGVNASRRCYSFSRRSG